MVSVFASHPDGGPSLSLSATALFNRVSSVVCRVCTVLCSSLPSACLSGSLAVTTDIQCCGQQLCLCVVCLFHSFLSPHLFCERWTGVSSFCVRECVGGVCESAETAIHSDRSDRSIPFAAYLESIICPSRLRVIHCSRFFCHVFFHFASLSFCVSPPLNALSHVFCASIASSSGLAVFLQLSASLRAALSFVSPAFHVSFNRLQLSLLLLLKACRCRRCSLSLSHLFSGPKRYSYCFAPPSFS